MQKMTLSRTTRASASPARRPRAIRAAAVVAMIALAVTGCQISLNADAGPSGASSQSSSSSAVMGALAGYPSYCAKPGQSVNADGYPPYRDDCAANKAMADAMASQAGLDTKQITCLNTLWQKSSGFDIYYEDGEGLGTGIPALHAWEQNDQQFWYWIGAPDPDGVKIARGTVSSSGQLTDGTTQLPPPLVTAKVQIGVGLSYIREYYGTACNALAFFNTHGFYSVS